MLERMRDPEKRAPMGTMDRMYMSLCKNTVRRDYVRVSICIRADERRRERVDWEEGRREAEVEEKLTVILTSSKPPIKGVNCLRRRVPPA